MHIAIACSSLCVSMGGSERAAINLAGEMATRGHDVSLLSMYYHNLQASEPLYTLHPAVTHTIWDGKGKHATLRAIQADLLRRGVDVFLSMQSGREHLFWAMGCMGSGIPFICSERCDPAFYTEQLVWNRPGRLAVLHGADIIHELLPAYVERVPDYLRRRVRVIPNAAPLETKAANAAGEPGRRKSLLYLARFDEQKRPLLLLDAFRQLADEYPDWDLVLRGHGPQEELLRRQIRAWGMEQRILMPGICRDAPSAYAEAQIYCLPSAYEGFPNTILEAMCAGLPVVGFAECVGVRDVIEHGKTGFVVAESSSSALAETLRRLMSSDRLRETLGKAAQAAAENYAPSKIYDQWEHLFAELARVKGKTVMDAFAEEPFASQARLSAVARREWLSRDFGMPMPYTVAWLRQRSSCLCRNLGLLAFKNLQAWGRRIVSKGRKAD